MPGSKDPESTASSLNASGHGCQDTKATVARVSDCRSLELQSFATGARSPYQRKERLRMSLGLPMAPALPGTCVASS